MAGEIPSGEGSLFHFLDIYALGFGLEACGALFLGKSWGWVALGVGGSIFFHLLGTKWPRIKPVIGPRVASTLERITSNRPYRRSIYVLMILATLASIGYRAYRHYYPSLVNLPASARATGPGIARPQDSVAATSGSPTQPVQGAAKPVKPSNLLKPKHSAPQSGPPSTTITAVTNAPNSAAVGVNTGTVNVGSQLRSIGDEDALANVLSARHGSISIDVHNPGGDTESYANSWLSVFHKARWSTIGVGKVISGTDIGPDGSPVQIPKGIHVYYKPAQSGLASFVAETIRSKGTDCHLPEMDPTIGAVDLKLFVGDQESAISVSPVAAPTVTKTQGQEQPTATGLIPSGIIPEDPEKAVEAVNRMRNSVAEVLGKNETVTFLMSWPGDDSKYLAFVSNVFGSACRPTPRQCWFTQPANEIDLDRPRVPNAGRRGITIHGPDAYAFASALGAWFTTYSSSTIPPELNTYNQWATKEIVWIEIGPGSPWKSTTK